MKHKKTILIDMDDTLTYHLDRWLEWLNSKYNTNVKKEDVKEWDMVKAFPNLTEEQILEPLDNPKFYKKLKIREDAAFYLQILNKVYSDRYQFYIVTNSRFKALDAKIENFLIQFYANDCDCFNQNNIIICKDKHLVKGDVLIDDNPENLRDFKGKRILMDMPHNQNIRGVKRLIRFSNWEEITNWILEHI